METPHCSENQRPPGPKGPNPHGSLPRAVAPSSWCWTPSFAANNSSLGGPGRYIHLGHGEIAGAHRCDNCEGDFIDLLIVKVWLT